MSECNPIKVSVLIPIYGVEQYIERSVRSLFEQTIQTGIEFIFVNDCTKDRSIELLEKVISEYPQRRAQIRIINHNSNKGLAVARVTGVKSAQGEYVIHCDSDDWVEPNMYELMYEEAKRIDADIVGCDFILENKNSHIYVNQNFRLHSSELICALLATEEVGSYLWNRMIRRSFYNEEIYFAEAGTSLFEDMAVTVPMHLNTNKVGYVNKGLYHYNQINLDSMTHIWNLNYVDSALKVLDKIKPLIIDIENGEKCFNKRYSYISSILIMGIDTYNPNRFRRITKSILDYSALSSRGKVSALLVNNGMYKMNYCLQWLIEKVIKKLYRILLN